MLPRPLIRQETAAPGPPAVRLVAATVEVSSSDESDEGYENDPEVLLSDVKQSMTINFSIRANYTRWEPREAFRELVQNWRDGIIKSFKLAEKDFFVMREEKTIGRNTEIVYKVPYLRSTDRKEWLGYIRFKGCDGEGTIEITNRNATLEPANLDLGATAKANDRHQAGAHGEGLKIALIVLMRGQQNHCVRCRTGGFNWRFNFTTRGRLVARLRRMTPDSISRAESQAQRLCQRTLLPFAVEPRRDVQFVIGERHQGRDQQGISVKRTAVKLENFLQWTKAALFLHDDKNESMVSTEHGDLLTDPQLRGNIYLKGLLLDESIPGRSASITNRPLKFGYNFAFGRTNRERHSVAGADEESRAIMAIWSKVLDTKPDLVAELSDMLSDDETSYADIAGAKERMDTRTACRLKEHLFKEQGKWYYVGEDKNNNPRLEHIIRGLGCEGVELTKLYWTILRQRNLVITAEEEERRRFTVAPPADFPQTGFAIQVHHLLRACVRACPQTDGMIITFVQAGSLDLQLFFSEAENLFRLHERWLSPDSATTELGLPQSLSEYDKIFHAVKRLFGEALEQLPRSAFVEEGDTKAVEWRRQLQISLAEQRLLELVRLYGEISIDVSGASFIATVQRNTPASRFYQALEIQCHGPLRCSIANNCPLITEDALSAAITCIPPRIGGEPNVQAQSTACWVARNDPFGDERFQFQLDEGKKYLFLLTLPDDPKSFVLVLSINCPTAPRAAQSSAARQRRNPPPTVNECPTDYASGEEDHGDFNNSTARPLSPGSPSTTIDRGLSPVNEPGRTEGSSTAQTSGETSQTPPTELFALGNRLESLNIFDIDSERWYEGKTSDNVRAVIGIVKGEKNLPGEPRKRRRVGEDE